MEAPLLMVPAVVDPDRQFFSVQIVSLDSLCVFCLWETCDPSAWEGSLLFSWEPFFPFVLHTHRAPPSSRRPFWIDCICSVCAMCLSCAMVWQFVVTQSTQCSVFLCIAPINCHLTMDSKATSVDWVTNNQCALQLNLALLGWEPVAA